MLLYNRSQRNRILIFALTLAMLPLLYNNCAEMQFSSLSPNENAALGVNPFDPNQNANKDNIDNSDAFIPTENLRIHSVTEVDNHWVTHCTLAQRAQERQEAIDAAIASRMDDDPTNDLIPVRFSISFGTAIDETAWAAHKRAILNSDDDGVTPYAVGPGNGLTEDYYEGANGFYYVTDHSAAREDYIHGRKCFYDTVKVIDQVAASGKIPTYFNTPYTSHQVLPADRYFHSANIMYYGNYVYTEEQEGASPRLFKKLWKIDGAHPDATPQIVPLYVADFRLPLFGLPPSEGSVIRTGVRSGLTRGQEIQINYKLLFDLPKIAKNFWPLIWNLSHDHDLVYQDVDGNTNPNQHYRYNGIVGAPQLLSNIWAEGVEGTVLPVQYTPIVLDLGQRGIRTSSVTWGTYFNLVNQTAYYPPQTGLNTTNSQGPSFPLPHRTAWIGGDLVDTKDSSASTENPYFTDIRRVADDGFLVQLKDDGSVTSGADLFGDHTIVGKQSYFANGFLALRAYAAQVDPTLAKDCDELQADLHKRYLGPWDHTLYDKKLGVWIDRNRNGYVDPGEVMHLKEAGVLAINVCYFVKGNPVDPTKPLTDAFGNRSDLRAAFLYATSDEDKNISDDEIIHRLKTGLKSNGSDAEFRPMIDIFFQSWPDVTLYPDGYVVNAPPAMTMNGSTPANAATTKVSGKPTVQKLQ